ncbi:MAG: hypothetical protein ACK4M7_07410, partial [Burkholderiales bacterium]
MFLLVCLVAQAQDKLTGNLIQTISSAGYDKQDNATFADTLAYIKRLIISRNYFNESAINDEFVKIRRQDLEI